MTTGTWIGAKWLSLIFGVYQKFSQKINHFRRTGFYFFKVNTTLQEISLRTEVCVILFPSLWLYILYYLPMTVENNNFPNYVSQQWYFIQSVSGRNDILKLYYATLPIFLISFI